MRSEERAGIVAAILLLLWGTVISFPLHIFTDYLDNTLTGAVGSVMQAVPQAIVTGIIILMLTVLEVLLLLLSKSNYAVYIPVTAVVITSAAFIIKCIRTMIFDTSIGLTLGITLAVFAVIHIIKAEKILIWLCDFFIYSISIFLFTGLIAMPLANRSETLRKLLFITRRQVTDLSVPFKDVLTLPAVVWGIFLFILFTLPVVYYSFSRKKA